MSMVPVSSQPSTTLSFWSFKNKRPDSVAGKLALFAGAAFVAYHSLDILTFLNKVVWNTISIGVGVGIIAGTFLLLRDGRLLKLVDFGIQFIIRHIVGQFVAVFPIDVMKSRLSDVDKILQNVTDRLAELRGARVKAQNTLEQFSAERTEHDSKFEQLAEHPSDSADDDKAAMAFHASAASRRIESIGRFTNLVARMDLAIKIITKLKLKATYIRADIADNIVFTEQERKALKSATSAIRSIKAIMMGSGISGQLYDMALEAANEQAADMIGEMEQFLDDSKNVMRDFDLEQYAAVDEALDRLQSREGSKVLSYNPGDGKVGQLEYKPGETVPVIMPATAETNDDINAFLKTKR